MRLVSEPNEWTELPPEERPVIKSPEDAAAIVAPTMAGAVQEEVWVVCMNMAGAVVSVDMIHRGGAAASIFDVPSIMRLALLAGAASIILAHNHPSGNPEPSTDDIAVTRQVVEAGRIVGIPVRDHLILHDRGYTSLAERGHC